MRHEKTLDIATSNESPRKEASVDREAVRIEHIEKPCWKHTESGAARKIAEA